MNVAEAARKVPAKICNPELFSFKPLGHPMVIRPIRCQLTQVDWNHQHSLDDDSNLKFVEIKFQVIRTMLAVYGCNIEK